jgi:type IV secretory pathway VirB10-like protein
MTRWITMAALALALALVGCGNKEAPKAEAPAPAKATAGEPKAEAPKPAEAAPAQPAPAPSKAEGEEPKAEAPKPAEGEAPASPAVPSEELKAKLSAAYADVYCAQISGKPEAVLEAYKRHGYENLEDWSRAWRAAAKDVDWVKAVMTDARNACPK